MRVLNSSSGLSTERREAEDRLPGAGGLGMTGAPYKLEDREALQKDNEVTRAYLVC